LEAQRDLIVTIAKMDSCATACEIAPDGVATRVTVSLPGRRLHGTLPDSDSWAIDSPAHRPGGNAGREIMAHKKGGGSTRNGRDSNPQYLGLKLFGGQMARSGCIILRQRGTPFKPGMNVRRGRDDTLYAITEGKVEFRGRVVCVVPAASAN